MVQSYFFMFLLRQNNVDKIFDTQYFLSHNQVQASGRWGLWEIACDNSNMLEMKEPSRELINKNEIKYSKQFAW